MAKIKKNFGNRPFTTMFNDHFCDKRLSWGAVGMLSNVFSLPDEWEFSVRGFMGMHADGQRVVTSLLYELEWFGYLERVQLRDTKGKVVDYIYEFFNESQLPDKTEPVPAWKNRKEFAIKRTQIIDVVTGEIISNIIDEPPYLQNVNTDKKEDENPRLQNADTGFADTENADTGFAQQLSTNESSTNIINNVSNQSINLSEEPKTAQKPKKKKTERVIDTETIQDIKDQIEYDVLLEDESIDHSLLDTIVSCIADLYAATEPQVFNNRTYSEEYLHNRSLEIDTEHIKYVLACFVEKREKVHNVRKYLLTAVFNAPDTYDAYYTNGARAAGLI